MRVRLLGTGTPTPSLKRMCSGYVVETGGDVILFDHGFGAHHRMMELGIPATRATHLFLSHLHYDHCGDYARLVLTRWDQGAGRPPELKVYGPPPLKEMSRKLFAEDGVYGPDLTARTRHECSLGIYRARGGAMPRRWPAPEVAELKSGDVVKSGDGWTVSVAAVRHFQPYLTCYGFRLDAEEGSFVYSGDSGPSEGMRKLARDCDVLVHMCHYVSGTQLNADFAESCMGHLELAELAREAGAKSLVATHVTEQFDRPGVRERVITEMAGVYKGAIYFGEDLMEIPIGPPALAKLM
jgi:ribonuclease BN (tRNA processing enzyme)